MLARHFVGLVGTVFAVEPSAEMRAIAARRFNGLVQHIDGFSDATTLPDNSVDLITVGRALHWFPANSTRKEFCRILKPDGWLAVFSVPCTNQALVDSLKKIRVEENGWEIAAEKTRMSMAPLSFYFGHDSLRKLSFPGSVQETWDEFLGRICSFAPAPKRDHPFRPRLERALREVFDRYAVDEVLHVPIATEATFGRVHGIFDKEAGA
jgi:SAM-dependent methyltransferase